MNALIVAAHPDDEVLGCGGTISKLSGQGHKVTVKICGQGRDSWADQRFDAWPLLEWTQDIERWITECKPDTLFTHWIGDQNRDHRIIAEAALIAARCSPEQCVREILCFEINQPLGWQDGFKPNLYFDISDHLEYKVDAMKLRYSAELRPYPHPRSEEGIRSLAKWRGAQVGVEAAEAFVLVRSVR